MAVKHTIRADGNGKVKTVSLTPVKAIRYQCIECMGFDIREVQLCQSPLCSLFPYRMGKNEALKGKRKCNLPSSMKVFKPNFERSQSGESFDTGVMEKE